MPGKFNGRWSIKMERQLFGNTPFVKARNSTVSDYNNQDFVFPMSIDHNGSEIEINLSAKDLSGKFDIDHKHGTPGKDQRTYAGNVKRLQVTHGEVTETFLVGIIGRTTAADGGPITDSDTVSFTAIKTGG